MFTKLRISQVQSLSTTLVKDFFAWPLSFWPRILNIYVTLRVCNVPLTILQITHHSININLENGFVFSQKSNCIVYCDLVRSDILHKSIEWHLNDHFPSGIIMFVLYTVVKNIISPFLCIPWFLFFIPLTFVKMAYAQGFACNDACNDPWPFEQRKALSTVKRVCLTRVSCVTTMYVIKWWRREERCGMFLLPSLLHHFITYIVVTHETRVKHTRFTVDGP